MWLEKKVNDFFPPAVKRKLIGYYRLIRPSSQQQPPQPLTPSQRRRMTRWVWALVGLAALALIASLLIPPWL